MTETPAAAPAPGRSAESPWQVREVSARMGDYLDRLTRVWIEGQVAEVNVRQGRGLIYLTLRDSTSEASIPLVCTRPVYDAVSDTLTDGAQVVVHAKVEWWDRRGEIKFRATEIRPVGIGELLAVLEARRKTLAAEGLFDDSRKRPLPFLPRTIGLICGRSSAAMADVVENARRRWPSATFDVREVPVQGSEAAAAVRKALTDLDRAPEVDVIVIARGGGSFEDLLPFSDESLVRAVAAALTPVVSAIGHEEDSPLLDLVADLRASTPTDAARRIVPDVREERAGVRAARDRMRAAVSLRLTHAARDVAAARAHPALRAPASLITDRVRAVHDLRRASRSRTESRLSREQALALGRRAELMALSPQATLDRGFAVVRLPATRTVVTSSDAVTMGEVLEVRLARGSLDVSVLHTHRPEIEPARGDS